MLACIFGISTFSLIAALIAQYQFGLEPCILCLYQRVPFVAAGLLTLAGLALLKKKQNTAPFLIGVCGLFFLLNAAIAFYHSGVERHWWASFLEGCKLDFGADTADTAGLLESIMSATAVRCDVIPWVDPLLGLSMANYNVLLCSGLFGVCMLSAALMMRQARRP